MQYLIPFCVESKSHGMILTQYHAVAYIFIVLIIKFLIQSNQQQENSMFVTRLM